MNKSNRLKRKSWRQKLVTAAVAACFVGEFAHANPIGPTVVNGQVSFVNNGNVLQVTNTPGAVVNWRAFSIGANEVTRFIQQSASSSILNRVTGADPSTILGALQSNGRVFLINPSGVIFGANAQVSTAGLVVSTLGLSDADFLANRHRYTATPGAGAITNQGSITTSTGGSVYLIAPNVINTGIIRGDGGEILLAAGNTVELVNANSPDLRVQITAPDNQAVNLGQIVSQGGRIGIYGSLIRQGGVVNANTAVRGENGKIVFKATKDVALEAGSSTTASGPTGGSISIQAESGKATIAGAVEAIGTQGKGGTIEVAGQQGVAVESTARITASGTEGGSVTLNSTGGPVVVAAPVTANATAGRAGEVVVSAATIAVLAASGQLSASGAQGGGVISVKGSNGVTFDAGSAVAASGATGGTVSVQADQGTVVAQGTIDVIATEGVGGNVQLAARADITLDVGSQILAGGRSGGEVKVESREGTLLASGLVDGQGNEGPGGRIWLLAPRVGLIREATVNASGLTGGGTVLVGGDFQGKNPDIQNAWRTYFGRDATVRADAIQSGNGGKVIVWADDWTHYFGAISARGGALSGNGGFVEVSGKNSLRFDGHVDAGAPNGALGTLLLDPKFIEVKTAGGVAYDPTAVTGNNLFATPDATSTQTITPGSLDTANANIVLQANNDVTFTDAVNMTHGGRTLTVQAGRSILINNDITTKDAAISMTANETVANGVVNAQRDAGNAVITMAAGKTIDAGNKNITLLVSTGPTTNNASGSITLANLTTSGDVLVVNNGATAGSSILRADNTQLITAGSAAFDVSAASGGSVGLQAAPIRVTAPNVEARGQGGGVFISSPTAAVIVGGAALGGLTGISTAGNGNIELTAAANKITTSESIAANGSGNVKLTATGAAADIIIGAAGSVSSGTGTLTLDAGAGRDVKLEASALSTGNTTANAVSVTAGATGAITDTNNADNAAAAANIKVTGIGAGVTLVAGDNVGAAAAGRLDIAYTGTGSALVVNAGADYRLRLLQGGGTGTLVGHHAAFAEDDALREPVKHGGLGAVGGEDLFGAHQGLQRQAEALLGILDRSHNGQAGAGRPVQNGRRDQTAGNFHENQRRPLRLLRGH